MILSKSMQSVAFTSLLKTLKETENFGSKSLDQWPTYATTFRKCTEVEGSQDYQCQELSCFSEAVTLYDSHYDDYCSKVSQLYEISSFVVQS